ncbi:DUF499 domain-containing protein [Candidatus Bipolaricaulota bacterium]|nr:DUF499 domain-containing protein [Candidatus Bipolaricaulota bacterium]
MKNWYEVAEPHEDIKNEEFGMDVFAADIGDVVTDSAPMDYNDPDTFARKTYYTEGLTGLLEKVQKRLTKGRGDSIIQLQTPFGGGKTHSLLSIYHYINSGAQISNLLPSEVSPVEAKSAVLPCDHLNPQEGRREDGINIQTLWGEIGYRLDGEEGYEEFSENDENRIAPGADKLTDFLQSQEPFVLLFDEVLEYISNALGVEYAKSNLGSQTFSFLKGLTKAVGSADNGLLVVTLPSSELEDFTPKKEEGLATLNKIFGRVETIESPVRGDEIYTIIQKRLFQNLDESKRDDVVHEYFENYRSHKEDVPAKATEKEYKERLNLAYPFHPETIDILREKWGTFSSFQRTRGVLRLLAQVVGDLYQSEKNIDMILPADVSLDDENIRQEFTKHIGTQYDSIIASDIAGPDAKAQALDRSNKEWNHLAERITTAIFLHSFTAEDSEKGSGLEQIKLSTMRPETSPPMVTEIKEKLAGELWYLNERDGNYYFSTIPNLNRMIRDKKELLQSEEEKIRKRLKNTIKDEVGNALKTFVWPRRPNDIPDNQQLKLIVLDPDREYDLEKWITKRKNKPRTNQNTLIFGKASSKGTGNLKDQIKEHMALVEIRKEIRSGENESLETKLEEVQDRIDQIEGDFSYNVRKMYNIIQVGNREIDIGMPSAGRESLSNWYRQQLEDEEEILTNLHYRMIINKFLADKDVLKTKKVLEQFYKDRSSPMLEDDDLVKRALARGVSDGQLGIGQKEYEDIDPDSVFFDEQINKDRISLSESEVMISKDKAKSLIEIGEEEEEKTGEKGGGEIEQPGPEVPTGVGGGPGTATEEGGEQKVGTSETGSDTPSTKKYRKLNLSIDNLPTNSFADFFKGVIKPLTKEIGGFELKVEIDIENEDGVDEEIYEKTIKETINQLKAKLTREELE